MQLKKMKKLIIILSLFFNPFLFANNCEDRVKKVFSNIIESIGNNSVFPPNLIFSDLEKNAAYMSGESITIEYKLISLFCEEENFEDKIAFILSHELAHYYLQHDWMLNTGLSYASKVGKSLKYKSYSYDEIKEAESQADIYAGFYAMITGYKPLEFAETTLNKVYESYNLPRDLKKYPSYEDRVTIINDKKKQVNELATMFEIANILFKLKKYSLSKDAFEAILKSKFNSREIYNNLGLSYLMYGISISESQISNLLFPVSLDLETRASISKTRSSFTDSPKEMIENSKKYFERSISLDENYIPAKQNLFVSDMLLAETIEIRNDLMNDINKSLLNEQTKVDFEVINELLNNTKLKKIKKIAKYGSYLSKLNLQENPENLTIKTLNKKEILNKLNIESELEQFFIGWIKPDRKIKVRDLIYKIKIIKGIEVSQVNNKTSLLKIPENLYNNNFNEEEKSNFITTSLGIYTLINNE